MITKEAIEAGARGVYYAAEVIKEHDDVDGLDWEVDWGDVKDSYPATHEHCVEVATACLTAAFAAMPVPAVRVKPLEWRLEDERDADFPRWNAEWNGIVFSVFKAWWGSKSKWGFVGGGDFHHTEEAAKAAAQADYEARILSAITPASDLAAENERLRAFKIGDIVKKRSGSWWEGRVVGFYSTEQTTDGVCVQLDKPMGPVQIYPAAALERT